MWIDTAKPERARSQLSLISFFRMRRYQPFEAHCVGASG
jgi:hypothetical protein